MKLLIATLILVLAGLPLADALEAKLTFPLYSRCNSSLEKLKSDLHRRDRDVKFEIAETKFGVKPEYGEIPYGIGTLQVSGDLQLLHGTVEEYLQLLISSMFSECMPNNAVGIKNKEIASLIREKFGENVISGYAKGDVFWILTNDGTYKMPE